jgi:hypothetical protein
MNPVRHIPMVRSPRKIPFVPRSSLQSIPAIRSLAWRRGAGDVTTQDQVGQQTDQMGQGLYQDPIANVDDSGSRGTGASTSGGGGGSAALPGANTSVYGATQVAVTPASGANLRDQPSTSGNVIVGENQGTILQVVGAPQNGWLNVQDPQGRVGWIYSAYVTDASGGQGTLDAPGSAPAASMAAAPLGATGIVGLLVVGGLVTGAYYLLVK